MSDDPNPQGLPAAAPDVDTVDPIAELETEGGAAVPSGQTAPHIEHAGEQSGA